MNYEIDDLWKDYYKKFLLYLEDGSANFKNVSNSNLHFQNVCERWDNSIFFQYVMSITKVYLSLRNT